MTTTTTNERARGTIRWLEETLRETVDYIDDDELQAEVFVWLKEVSHLPEADVMDHIEDHLSAVRRNDSDGTITQHPMRRVDGDGEGDFPDSCEGCPHYGVRCPVFVDPVELDRRERIQTEHTNSTSTAVRQAYRRFADQNQCHQITEALTAWSKDYQALVERGWSLYQETHDIQPTAVEDVPDRVAATVEEMTDG